MKTVVVTGGTVRLGRAIADRLRTAGWRVLTTSHRADAGADFLADFTRAGGAVSFYADLLRRLDGAPPDALVNNAALFRGDAADLRAVDFDAPCRLTQLMAGRETGVGSVVNVLDAAVFGTPPPASRAPADYYAAKADLFQWTRRAAGLFAATLRVNAVAPGSVLPPPGVREPRADSLLDRRPTPADVAEAVAYLLDAPAVTGCVLPVDSGQHLLS